MNVDLLGVAARKIEINEQRYPAGRVRSSAQVHGIPRKPRGRLIGARCVTAPGSGGTPVENPD